MERMTAEELAGLKAVAMELRGLEWKVQIGSINGANRILTSEGDVVVSVTCGPSDDEARFIAAANPSTILRLVEQAGRVEGLEQEIRFLRAGMLKSPTTAATLTPDTPRKEGDGMGHLESLMANYGESYAPKSAYAPASKLDAPAPPEVAADTIANANAAFDDRFSKDSHVGWKPLDYWQGGWSAACKFASPAAPVAAGLPATTEDEQIALLCKIEEYMDITDKLGSGSQTHPDCVAVENEIYALVDGFMAKRAAAPVLPVEVPSQPQDQSDVMPPFAGPASQQEASGKVLTAERIHEIEMEIVKDWPSLGLATCVSVLALARAIEAEVASGFREGRNAQSESSPIAEPDTATEAVSEGIDTPEFSGLLSRYRTTRAETVKAARSALIDYIHSWHQRATQASHLKGE